MNVLRKWVKELAADPAQAFPGQGQMKPEQLEIERLRRGLAKLRRSPTCLKKWPQPTSRGSAMRFAFIAKRRSIWQICVGRTGYGFATRWMSRAPGSMSPG